MPRRTPGRAPRGAPGLDRHGPVHQSLQRRRRGVAASRPATNPSTFCSTHLLFVCFLFSVLCCLMFFILERCRPPRTMNKTQNQTQRRSKPAATASLVRKRRFTWRGCDPAVRHEHAGETWTLSLAVVFEALWQSCSTAPGAQQRNPFIFYVIILLFFMLGFISCFYFIFVYP